MAASGAPDVDGRSSRVGFGGLLRPRRLRRWSAVPPGPLRRCHRPGSGQRLASCADRRADHAFGSDAALGSLVGRAVWGRERYGHAFPQPWPEPRGYECRDSNQRGHRGGAIRTLRGAVPERPAHRTGLARHLRHRACPVARLRRKRSPRKPQADRTGVRRRADRQPGGGRAVHRTRPKPTRRAACGR